MAVLLKKKNKEIYYKVFFLNFGADKLTNNV